MTALACCPDWDAPAWRDPDVGGGIAGPGWSCGEAGEWRHVAGAVVRRFWRGQDAGFSAVRRSGETRDFLRGEWGAVASIAAAAWAREKQPPPPRPRKPWHIGPGDAPLETREAE